MKYSNNLQKECLNYILNDGRFFYIGYTGTHFIATWEKGDKSEGVFIDLKKEHSAKTLAKVKISFFDDRYNTSEVEFKIEMYLNSHCTWEMVFEGWVENIKEFKLAIKMVGL